MSWEPKDPDEVLDYEIDWSDVLAADGDTIQSVVWTLPSISGLTKVSQDESAGVARIWLSGGNLRAKPWDVACRMVTAGGRTYDRTAPLYVARR